MREGAPNSSDVRAELKTQGWKECAAAIAAERRQKMLSDKMVLTSLRA